MNETMSAYEKGIAVISSLHSPASLHAQVFRKGADMLRITNEDGILSEWDNFVAFPPELSRVFPGSYVDPRLFLEEMKISGSEHDRFIQGMMGSELGNYDNPRFRHVEKNFDLRVIHGATNEHSLQLTRLATQGFQDPRIRAQYQNEMYEIIEPALRVQPPAYQVRIHDDCLASGDSIAGYLLKRLEEGSDSLKAGVEVVIDGPATAQGILFLRSFAAAHDIPLHITAGYMAFGLSQGVEENGVRKHANYITYPDELMEHMGTGAREVLKGMRAPDGNIYVVGDMGEAEQGIEGSIMEEIRVETGNSQLCPWNEHREDPHGNHPKSNGRLPVPPLQDGREEDIYFARGGYLPYAFDKMIYPRFDETNKIVERASRLWSQEYGYGAAFKEV